MCPDAAMDRISVPAVATFRVSSFTDISPVSVRVVMIF